MDQKEKELQKKQKYDKRDILVKYQENVGIDKDLFMNWLKNIWFAFCIKKIVSNSLLIFVSDITHFNNNLTNEIDRERIKKL